MRAIAEEGRGLVIYEHQEGRGIGLMSKLRAYALQDQGFDTVEANDALGFANDYRDFTLPAAILHDLGITQIRLLSNNPDKARALCEAGIEVAEVNPCEAAPNSHSLIYLQTKKEKMGHTLTLERRGSVDDPTREAFGVVSCDFEDRPTAAGSTRSTKSHEQTQSYFVDDERAKNNQEAFGGISGDFVDRRSVEERIRSTKSHEQTLSSFLNEQAEERYEFEGVDDPSCEAFGVASCDFVDRRSGSPRITKSHEQTRNYFFR